MTSRSVTVNTSSEYSQSTKAKDSVHSVSRETGKQTIFYPLSCIYKIKSCKVMGETFIAEQAITHAIKNDIAKEVFVNFLCYSVLFKEALGVIIIYCL